MDKTLSSEVNRINMKKVRVNAEVKAMISCLESFSNILYAIITGLLTVRKSFITLLPIMTVYLVLLPYAFLMNTSHNKNRIVELGWKNVIRNLFRRTTNVIAFEQKGSKIIEKHIKERNEHLKMSKESKRRQVGKEDVTKIITTAPNVSVKNTWLRTSPSTTKLHGKSSETPLCASRLSVDNQLEKKYKDTSLQTSRTKTIQNRNVKEKGDIYSNMLMLERDDQNGIILAESPLDNELLPNSVPENNI